MPTPPDWLASTLAADAAQRLGAPDGRALPPWIRALDPGSSVAGPALVVAVTVDDNSPMRDVPARATPGCVVVVAGAAESRTAVLGDLVARELRNAGVAGVVTDGLVRDSQAVIALGLPVWARGTTPVASRKNGAGHVGGAVPIAGTVVHDGDLVVGDADGVVVWPGDAVEEHLQAADAKRQADAERERALEAAAPPS